jgi:RNA polymerase sigma factor (sigma-70 family)
VNRQDWDAYAAARAEDPKSKKTLRLRDKLVADNLGLVKSTVIKFVRVCGLGFQDTDDFMQAGTIGLMRAIDLFNPEKAAFSTYAMHWIKNEIGRARGQTNPIRIPPGKGMPLTVQIRIILYRQLHGCDPTAEEIGTIGKPGKEVVVTQEMMDRWAAFPRVESFETATIGQGDAEASEEYGVMGCAPMNRGGLQASDAPSIEETIEATQTDEMLREDLEDLTKSERHVITRVYWEDAEDADVAKEKGVTRQAISNCRLRGLAKLQKAFVKKSPPAFVIADGRKVRNTWGSE